ncbi:MAG: cell wall metabolism sensor histidine kinase WalK [bacterium]|nr:cell wall metabolism sensor histidine kinase WalK [bacterium]
MSSNDFSSKLNLRRYLQHGEAMVAMTGMAFIAILSFVVGGLAWVSARSIEDSAAAQAEQRVAETSSFIASQSELRLSDRDVSGLRRMLLDSVASSIITSGRVSVPGVGVIASTEPNEITVNEFPETVSSVSESPASTLYDPETQLATVTEPLQVDGHLAFILELEIDQSQRIAGSDTIRASSVGIVAVGLVLTLVVYRRFRNRLGALAAIRESLRQVQLGERRTECLRVGDTLGQEAEAWNTLLSERDELDRAVCENEIAEIGAGGGGDSLGLPVACNALTQSLMLVDQDFSVVYANGAASVMLGVIRDELVGMDLSHLEGHEKLVETIRDMMRGQHATRAVVELGDTDNLEVSGSVLRANIAMVEDEGLPRVVVFIEDITQQKLSSQSQNAFIAQATHELRTPLTTIRLYCDEAIEADSDDAQIVEKSLNVISSEARRLERIVGDMLCVSEIEAGSLSIRREKFRTGQLFDELLHDYEAQAKEKSIELSFDLPPKFPTIDADRDRLGQAIHNLVGNAIKYTPSGGKVSVTASFDENDAMSVAISDTGIGIDESQQERIFERFTRAEDRRIAHVTGSGLGLALARQIARLHGGDITLESEIDQGSTFTMLIPGTASAKQAA